MANASQLTDPIAITPSSTAGIGNSAVDFRFALAGLTAPARTSVFGTDSGVFPGASIAGALPQDMGVSNRFGLTVSVAAGTYQVDRGSYGTYLGAVTGAVDVTLEAANSTNPRYDYVILRLRDPGVDSNPSTSAVLTYLKGTAAASPVEPSAQLTSGDLLLARVLVGAGATALSAGNIADRRLFVAARGGVVPRPSWDGRPGAYEGQYRDNLVTNTLDRWTAGAWVAVAAPGSWAQYSPSLYYGGSTDPLKAGTTVANLGADAVSVGRYIQIGKRLDFNLYIKWGTSPYNMGTGFITTTLPPNIYHSESAGESHLMANLYVADTYSSTYKNFQGNGFIQPGSNVLWPQFIRGNGNFDTNFYTVATTAGAPGTGIPYVAAGFPQGGTLTINGTIEVA